MLSPFSFNKYNILRLEYKNLLFFKICSIIVKTM